jgi:heat shock protein HtpX
MPDVGAPVLVYDRIEENRQTTKRLLTAFALVLLPFASGATVWLMPLIVGPLMLFVGSSPKLQSYVQQMSTSELAALEVGMLVLALLAVTVGMAVATASFLNRYGPSMVLRTARARLTERETELDLHRLVENLCIGAGLPKPRIYVIESSTANAFAIGRDPADASIVVSRGLLTLLERRELEGVIAHELSHVGNHDIRLNTTLAAMIGALTIPLTIIAAILGRHRIIAVFGGFILLQFGAGFVLMGQVLLSGEIELPSFLRWWILHALFAPFYVVLIAPGIGKLVQRAVSREREYLADADAVLLTRNPRALATALVKVDKMVGSPIRVGPATEHLYFVDPLGENAPWLARLFRTHPPIAERLELLERMGSGIAKTVLEDTAEPEIKPPEIAAPPGAPAPAPELGDGADVRSSEAALGRRFRVKERELSLYEKPDGWSRVVQRLERGTVVTARGKESGFLLVSTGEGVVGYLGGRGRLAVEGEDEGV